MRAALPVLLAGLMIAQAAQAQGLTPEAQGRRLVERHCAACHAVGERGASAEPAAPPFRELYKRYEVENLAEALSEGLLVGHPQMPEFRFAPEQVDAIIRYLRTLQPKQAAQGAAAGETGR